MKTNFILLSLLFCVVFIHAQQTKNDYLSRWQFENNASDTQEIQDGSPESGTSFSNTDKKEGDYSAYFNGTGAFIVVPNFPELNNLAAFSMSFWVKPLAFTTGDATFIAGKESCYRLLMQADGSLKFVVATTNNPWYSKTITGNTNLQLNNWYFVTVGYDGSRIYIYLNGVEIGSTDGLSGNTVTDGHNLTFGGLPAESLDWLKGYMDDVRFYDFSLTPENITDLYNSYNTTTGFMNVSKSNNGILSVFPNSAKSGINILFDAKHIGDNFSVISVTGQVIEKNIITNTSIYKDISSYVPGVYFLKIEGESSLKKIIVQ